MYKMDIHVIVLYQRISTYRTSSSRVQGTEMALKAEAGSTTATWDQGRWTVGRVLVVPQ